MVQASVQQLLLQLPQIGKSTVPYTSQPACTSVIFLKLSGNRGHMWTASARVPGPQWEQLLLALGTWWPPKKRTGTLGLKATSEWVIREGDDWERQIRKLCMQLPEIANRQ